MNHRVGRIVFATAVGLIVALLSYRWITDPTGRMEREQQIAVVEASRETLRTVVDLPDFEIVDTLAPDRKVGKAYIYPEGSAWAVSGYYRRDEDDRWHPYLMSLDTDLSLISLKIQDSDPGLARKAASDARLEIVR